MTIGEQLLNARKAKGLTQAEVSRRLHVVRQTVSGWETGRNYPDIGSLIALADLYALSLDDLLREGTDMVKDMERKDQLLHEMRRAYWLTLGLDLVLLVTLVGHLLHFAAFAMGPAVLVVVGVVIVIDAVVLIIVSQRFRTLRKTVAPEPLWVLLALAGFCLVGVAVVLVGFGVTPLTLGLTVGLVAGWGVIFWQRRSHHESD